MIIEYNDSYKKDVKDLFVELQEYIESIDAEGYNIVTKNYRENYFNKVIKEVVDNQGKIFLYEQEGKIIGLIVGIINNEKQDTFDFKAPKRGRITELIVTSKSRKSGIGKKLLNYMENYLIKEGCKAILLEVFGYNLDAIKFYEKNGYHTRLIDMSKSNF